MKTILAVLAEVEWNGHMNDGWWAVMVVGMILFLTLTILGILWLVRDLGQGQEQNATALPQQDPLAILDQRLASGEISPEEYRERRAILRGTDEP